MGGRVDFTVQRFVDIWMSIPGLVLLITLAAALPSNTIGTSLAIGAILAGNGVRIIRSSCLSIVTMPYVEAARSLGASDLRIIWSYILRNVAAFVIIVASTQVGVAILLEANISFLGFGVGPPVPAWGSMLGGQGRQFMLQAPWLSIWPGLAIAVVVFGANVFGDAIRDALDPYVSRGRGE
jgi:peptide/nickel transport system permease protein